MTTEKDKTKTKTKNIDKAQVTLIIPIEASNQIDNIVAKIPNMSKNQFMSNLLMIGLDDVKLLDSLGLISGIEYIRAIMEQSVSLFRKNSSQTGVSFKN
jgi:hypothetical protein